MTKAYQNDMIESKGVQLMDRHRRLIYQEGEWEYVILQ